MALSKEALQVINPHIRNARILSLGYPDILLSRENASLFFGVQPTKFTENGAWHKVVDKLPETVEFFGLLGSTIDCVDIHQSRGVERVVDLNQEHDFGLYDLVIDAGTIEHCCNIGQALMNAVNAVKVGGYIFHVPPMSMMNHGFYNISPTLLHDFYTQNGWTIEHFTAHGKTGPVDLHPTKRFQAKPDAWMFFLAKRNSDLKPKWPMQTKYMNHPNL